MECGLREGRLSCKCNLSYLMAGQDLMTLLRAPEHCGVMRVLTGDGRYGFVFWLAARPSPGVPDPTRVLGFH
jgi:hypothetical protein